MSTCRTHQWIRRTGAFAGQGKERLFGRGPKPYSMSYCVIEFQSDGGKSHLKVVRDVSLYAC